MTDFFQQKLYTNWVELEKDLENIEDNKTKGDLFEIFSYFYFLYFRNLYQIEHLYSQKVKGGRPPVAVIKSLGLDANDMGVDGIFITKLGQTVAYQSKFRSRRKSPTYSELSTFWTEAEKADYRLVISNTQTLPSIANKKKGHQSVLVDLLDGLDEQFFIAMHQWANDNSKVIAPEKKNPRPYQRVILKAVVSGLEKHDRGKLIAACGIGKTLLSLWIVESLKTRCVLFVAPSLQLVRQTLKEWSTQASREFNYLCVCSDETVDIQKDTAGLAQNESDIAVTTNVADVVQFLKTPLTTKFIFSTYQSLDVISAAELRIRGFSFDMVVCDEAHHTAGVDGNSLFSMVLDNNNIPSRKRLFMTATERIVTPRVRTKLLEVGKTIFSMEDERTYGPVLYKLNFGEAISNNIISDYRIVVSAIGPSELKQLITTNRYVRDDAAATGAEPIAELAKRLILMKSIDQLSITKAVSFHSKVAEAKAFAARLEAGFKQSGINKAKVFHVNGSMTAAVRSEYIREFEESDVAVITNVRCLNEGVDVPAMDGVFFCDPKESQIDIVQAVGRALRQPYGTRGKIAYIVIPILFEADHNVTLQGAGFDSLYNLIQSLRDQDQEIADWIDQINLSAATGRSKNGRRSSGKLKIILPESIDVVKFQESLILEIATVNSNPSGTVGLGSSLGKGERKSEFVRLFRTMADMNVDVLEMSNIRPTLLKMKPDRKYIRQDLRVNNNNVSSSLKFGAIKYVDSGKIMELTKLGIMLKNGNIEFNVAMASQMLVFKDPDSGLYPYREFMAFISALKTMNYHQFLFGLYSLQLDEDGKPEMADAVQRAKFVADKYPNIALLNNNNRFDALEELNKMHPVGFGERDVWTDRTTACNQYRYLINHLSVFGPLFEITEGRAMFLRRLVVSDAGITKIRRMLEASEGMISNGNYGDVLCKRLY